MTSNVLSSVARSRSAKQFRQLIRGRAPGSAHRGGRTCRDCARPVRLRLVVSTSDVPVPIDDRSGDDPTAVRQEQHREVRDLIDLTQPANRYRAVGFLQPSVIAGMELALDGVLALGLGPADV